MATRRRGDPNVRMRLDELESRLIQLKILYEKYFSGLESLEPSRDRERIKRLVIELTRTPIQNTAQRYRFQSLRSRYTSLDQYLTRNLVMIERGTHPKFKFRADLADRRRGRGTGGTPQVLTRRSADPQDSETENHALRSVYDQFMDARRSCGQTANVPFEDVRTVLAQEVERVKTEQDCRGVRFRVTVENGKAHVRALPVN